MGTSDRATSSCSSDSEIDVNIQSSISRRRHLRKLSEEKRQCAETFATLRRLVNAGEGLTQLELLQKIIDHISDLQAELNKCDFDVLENKENFGATRTLDAEEPNCEILSKSRKFKCDLRKVNG